MTKADGFSLVEVLIAAAILAVTLLSLSSMFPTGYLNVDQGGERTTAVTLAQERIEWLRNQPYVALAAGTTTEGAIPGYTGYSRMTTIQDDNPTFGVKQVTVAVTTPAGGSVQVTSLIAR